MKTLNIGTCFEGIVIFGRKLCLFFIEKLSLFLKKSLPDNQFVFLLNVFEIRSHQGFPKFHKNCIKFLKTRIFCVFVNFGQILMHFFKTNCFHLFKDATATTSLLLSECLQHSKPPNFSKSTQKLHKSFKNPNFQVFCQF